MSARREAAAAAAIPAVVGALLGCSLMTSFDLPLMVASGERLLATGEVPRVNPFLWTFPAYAWLDDKWLFGLACAAAERLAGGVGLTLLNALLGALAGVLLHAVARRRHGAWEAAGVACAAVTVLSYRSMLRAEWISALGVAWTLLHLDGIAAGSWRRAALVVAAMPVWAACHVYWFLGPLVLLVGAAAGRSAHAALVALGAAAAAAISPYGLENVAHPYRVVTTTAWLEVTEMRVPFVSGPWSWYHVLAALFAVSLLGWIVGDARERRWRDAAVGALLLVFCLRYDRNLAFLGVAYAFAKRPRAKERPNETPARAVRRHAWVAVPALAGLVAGVPFLAPERRFGLGWDETALPFALVRALPEETRAHRYVNDFSVGSFLDLARGASFIDGNSHGYPPEHYALYRSALEGTTSVAEVDRRFPNDGWLLRTSAPHTRVLVVGLALEGDYAPTDHDAVATLFRPVADPERADALWRDWLRDRYLPAARAWFADSAALGPAPAEDDVAGWRERIVRSPWDRATVAGLRRAYEVRGEPVLAARLWRVERRLGD